MAKPTPLKHELIRASAGTGKTYQLTNRYLRLLRMGEQPQDILASTFTRKAAGEILDRVLLRLAAGATDPAELSNLRNALEDKTLTRQACLDLLVEAAQNLHRLRIGTLDSLFIQLAHSFSLDLGLPPGWNIADEHVDLRLQDQAVDGLLAGEQTADLITLVHSLTHGETTRSLDREVRDRVKSLYGIYRETEAKAWQRVPRGKTLTEDQLTAAIDILKSVQLPKNKHWTNQHKKDVQAAEEANWEKFISRGIAGKVAAGEDRYHQKPIEAPVVDAYQPLLHHAKGVLLNRLADQTAATWHLLDKYHDHYQRLKRQQRVLRFEDVTFQLASAVSPIGAAQAAFRLDAPIRHLLLDEFQDTSLLQWKVVQPYVRQITQGKQGQSFFCVGDVKQAIYGWRGGVAEVFGSAHAEIPDCKEQSLDVSWRSAPVIIETVNEIFKHLDNHTNLGDLEEPVTQWQKKFRPHQTAGPIQKHQGYACMQVARSAGEDESEEQKVITLRFAAEQVADWKRQAPGQSIGVLVRRNEAVRRLIYELRELGIEASEEGGSSLDDSAAVRVVLSLVHLADHPSDRVARYHLANSPLSSWLNWYGGSKSLNPREMASSTGNSIAGCCGRAVRQQLMDIGYGKAINGWAKQLAPACNQRELRRLEKLIGLAYLYDTHANSRPDDFIRYIETQKVHDPMAADVRVMTIHQAKGLEFDIVVLTDLEANLVGQRDHLVVGRPSPTEPIEHVCRRCNAQIRELLPPAWQHRFQETDHQNVAESLCVLYVAVTRAVHVLHMIVDPSNANEKSLHKQLSGLLRAALTDGQRLEPEQIVFEHGQRQAIVGKEVDPEIPQTTKKEKKAEAISLAPSSNHHRRGLERVSPSELEGTGGGTTVRFTNTWSRRSQGKSDQGRTAALQRGTLIHAWFEQINWLEEGLPDEASLRLVAEKAITGSLDECDWPTLIDEFHQMCAQPQIAACLRRDAYAQYATTIDNFSSQAENLGPTENLVVENERPIAIRDGEHLLTGHIDRLVTCYQQGRPVAAEILDYKTDAISDRTQLLEKVEYYRPQLEAYRRAVCQTFQLAESQVAAKLLFVTSGEVELVVA
ncbi:MAG: UvrD-helicase domain-containing protein [Pirellulales bacterium]